MCWSEPTGPSRCLAPYSAQAGSRPHQQGEVVLTQEVKFAKRGLTRGPAGTGMWLSLASLLIPSFISHRTQLLKDRNAMCSLPGLHLPEILPFLPLSWMIHLPEPVNSQRSLLTWPLDILWVLSLSFTWSSVPSSILSCYYTKVQLCPYLCHIFSAPPSH